MVMKFLKGFLEYLNDPAFRLKNEMRQCLSLKTETKNGGVEYKFIQFLIPF